MPAQEVIAAGEPIRVPPWVGWFVLILIALALRFR